MSNTKPKQLLQFTYSKYMHEIFLSEIDKVRRLYNETVMLILLEAQNKGQETQGETRQYWTG